MSVASLLPENMAQGGLADDFDGVITRARFAPWDYNGKIDHHVLAAHVTIKPDGDEPEVDVYLSAGNLDEFMPSNDGEKPVNTDNFGVKDGEGNPVEPFENFEGLYAVRVGKKEQLNNNSNFAQFMAALLEAKFPKDKVTASLSFMEGAYGHFNRIAQKKRQGLVRAQAEGQQQRQNDVLVMTEFKELRAAGKSAPTTAPKATGGGLKKGPSTASAPAAQPAASPASTGSTVAGGLDEKLTAIVNNAVAGAAEGLAKTKLPPIALAGLTGAEKGKGVSRVTNVEFLTSAGDGSDGKNWVFDAESGTLFGL